MQKKHFFKYMWTSKKYNFKKIGALSKSAEPLKKIFEVRYPVNDTFFFLKQRVVKI